MRMTEKQDAKYDKARGIKENSPRDKKQDAKMGVAQGKMKRKGK